MEAVVVMGVSGCGKSTVGTALAEALRLRFVDADDLHPAENKRKMSAGIPLDDADRRPWLERVAEWLAEHPDGGVVACSALKRSYRDVLRAGATDPFFVHLAGPPEAALERVQGRTDHFMPASLVASQYATLEQLQPDEHGITLDFRDPVDELVADVLARLQD